MHIYKKTHNYSIKNVSKTPKTTVLMHAFGPLGLAGPDIWLLASWFSQHLLLFPLPVLPLVSPAILLPPLLYSISSPFSPSLPAIPNFLHLLLFLFLLLFFPPPPLLFHSSSWSSDLDRVLVSKSWLYHSLKGIDLGQAVLWSSVSPSVKW